MIRFRLQVMIFCSIPDQLSASKELKQPYFWSYDNFFIHYTKSINSNLHVDKNKLIISFFSLQKVKNFKNQIPSMIREIVAQLPKYKDSILYQGTKQALGRLINKLPDQKNVPQDKKENYLRTFKQLDWSLTKVTPNWPEQIEHKIDHLKNNLISFENQLSQISKGSSLFCGSGGNPKELEKTHKNIMAFENFFYVIGVYQNKQSKEKIVEQVLEIVQKDKNGASKFSVSRVPVEESVKKQEQKPQTREQQPQTTMCQYCQLMLACSLCPNGYVAKKLVKQLPDTQWIAGILYEEGTVVDKNLQTAILYYQQARKKKNPEAIYRLGSLNERGMYGKPNQYIGMWQEASKLGHLESLTDMGYLYQNGLYDEDTQKEIMPANEQKALKYYMKAAEKNFPRALNNLATFYFNSKTYSNPKKCFQYLQRASQAQYVKSLHNLALIYIQGTIVNTDDVKGMGLLRRAAQKGDIQARILYIERMLNEAAKCTEDELIEIHKYCRELIAKDQELPEPYYFLGIMYEQGYAVQMQPKVSLLYYTVAASYRSEAALLKLGDCYKNGFGIQQDAKEAVRCYQQVAKTNPLALVYLGQMYQQGSHDLRANNQRAFQYYYEACNHNIPEAFYRLGNMYKYGKHVNKNEAKAQEYMEKGKALEKKNPNKLNSSSSELIQSSYYRRR